MEHLSIDIKINKKYLFVAVIILLSIVFLLTETIKAENELVKTEVGEVKILGTSPKKLPFFFTTNNSYILKGDLVQEVIKIKQYNLKISGIFKNGTCKIIDYSLENNKCSNKNNNCYKIIGNVYNIENNYYLLTRNQKVLKLIGDNLNHFTEKKVLIKGEVKKNNKIDEIIVEGFIFLK
ncbi:MAG: hypothetical protein ACOCRK_10940 [bacterium]